MQQDRLVNGWFRHAAFADFDAVAGRQDDVDAANLREFLQNAAGFVAEPGFLAQGGQRFPEHIRQEADQNVGQHPILFLVPDRPYAQIAFVNSERRFRFGELDVCLPELIVAPVADVSTYQIDR